MDSHVITEIPSQENGWQWCVEDFDETVWLPYAGVGAPKRGRVGDTGTLEYKNTTGSGYWCWTGAKS